MRNKQYEKRSVQKLEIPVGIHRKLKDKVPKMGMNNYITGVVETNVSKRDINFINKIDAIISEKDDNKTVPYRLMLDKSLHKALKKYSIDHEFEMRKFVLASVIQSLEKE